MPELTFYKRSKETCYKLELTTEIRILSYQSI